MAVRTAEPEPIDTRAMLNVLTSVKRGDFTVRMPVVNGTAGKVAAALNDIIESNQRLERELRRLGKQVGKEGHINRPADGGPAGPWTSRLDSVNKMIDELMRPNSEIARVIRAVANGDLSQTMPMDIDGRGLQGQYLQTDRAV